MSRSLVDGGCATEADRAAGPASSVRVAMGAGGGRRLLHVVERLQIRRDDVLRQRNIAERLAALADVGPSDWFDPEFLAGIRARAMSVTLVAGARVTQSLTIAGGV